MTHVSGFTCTMLMHHSRDALIIPRSSYHHVGSIGYEPLLPSSVAAERALNVRVQWKLATDGPTKEREAAVLPFLEQ
jgi:hypothetical protein